MWIGEGRGSALPLLRKFNATLRKGDKQRAETVYVGKGQGTVALLSRQAAEDMGLMEYHIEVTTATPPLWMGENWQEVADLVLIQTSLLFICR